MPILHSPVQFYSLETKKWLYTDEMEDHIHCHYARDYNGFHFRYDFYEHRWIRLSELETLALKQELNED